jgi:integrase
MVSLYRRKNGFYYVAARDPNGKRVFRSTGERRRGEALCQVSRVVSEIQQTPARPQNLRHLADQYIQELRDLGRTEGYLQNMDIYLHRFAERPGATQEELGRYAKSRSDGTVKRVMGLIRSFGIWLEEKGQGNPFAKLKKPSRWSGPVRKPGVLTLQKVVGLISSAKIPERRRALYAFCARTGLRKGEASKVKPGHFKEHADLGPVLVIPAASAKSREEQYIPLPQEVWEYFKKAAPFQLPRRPAEAIRVDLETLGFPRVDGMGDEIRFHSLRHFFVTSITQVAPIGTASKLARHAQVSTTGIYVRSDTSELRSAMDDAFMALDSPAAEPESECPQNTDEPASSTSAEMDGVSTPKEQTLPSEPENAPESLVTSQ